MKGGVGAQPRREIRHIAVPARQCGLERRGARARDGLRSGAGPAGHYRAPANSAGADPESGSQTSTSVATFPPVRGRRRALRRVRQARSRAAVADGDERSVAPGSNRDHPSARLRTAYGSREHVVPSRSAPSLQEGELDDERTHARSRRSACGRARRRRCLPAGRESIVAIEARCGLAELVPRWIARVAEPYPELVARAYRSCSSLPPLCGRRCQTEPSAYATARR